MGMLVLTRKLGEKIVIGDKTIVLTVLDIHHRVVSLGIDADRSIPVFRKELVSGKTEASPPRERNS